MVIPLAPCQCVDGVEKDVTGDSINGKSYKLEPVNPNSCMCYKSFDDDDDDNDDDDYDSEDDNEL